MNLDEACTQDCKHEHLMLETLTHSEVHEVDSRDSSRALVRTRNANYPGVHLATLSVHCRLQSPTLSILGLVLALNGRFHTSFSDYSLDPHDSISNQDSSSDGGSRSSRNSRIPHNLISLRCSALTMAAIETMGIVILDMEPRSGLLYVRSANTRRSTSMPIYPCIRDNENITATG